MSVIRGDFLGFTFDGVHSSELGIFRVSDGSRYTENLLPTFQDKTTQIPGADGIFYQGSYFTQRPISFSIAFDELSETQFRRLKALFGDKKIHNLIFDELPYKVYKVKTAGTPNLKYVCFDIESKEPSAQEDIYAPQLKTTLGRVYKGEGQLSFVAYTPYAKSLYKYIDYYMPNNVSNWNLMGNFSPEDVQYNYHEWAESSRMKLSTYTEEHNGQECQLDKYSNSGIVIYNAGDIETPFKLKFFFDWDKNHTPNSAEAEMTVSLLSNNAQKITFNKLGKMLKELKEKGDFGFQLNSKLNLIEGIDKDGNPTGTLYNKYISQGDFFKLPASPLTDFLLIGDAGLKPSVTIEYDYLYL